MPQKVRAKKAKVVRSARKGVRSVEPARSGTTARTEGVLAYMNRHVL